jgi:hypothetical protein
MTPQDRRIYVKLTWSDDLNGSCLSWLYLYQDCCARQPSADQDEEVVKAGYQDGASLYEVPSSLIYVPEPNQEMEPKKDTR